MNLFQGSRHCFLPLLIDVETIFSPFCFVFIGEQREENFSCGKTRSDTPGLVPRPHYFARAKRFVSRSPSENLFAARSPRIHHRSKFTDRD